MPTPPKLSGVVTVDALSATAKPELSDYLAAGSEYVRESRELNASAKKIAQIALSAGLGRCLKTELEVKVASLNAHAGELNVAGALRNARADVSESHPLDGLRLAVEIKRSILQWDAQSGTASEISGPSPSTSTSSSRSLSSAAS